MPEPAIPLARPEVGDAEAQAVARVLASGWLAQGPEVEAFEHEFASYVGAPRAIAVSSGTAALVLALQVCDVGPGDEVVTASHSFIATANAIRLVGALPVFVDVDPATYNIDPARIEAVLSPRTRAIVCVHQMGMPCDLAALVALSRRCRLVLIEDAACAAGSEIRWDGAWQRIGRPHGDLACFSFHPRKLLTTGEGGMITTANGEWSARLRRLRQHGMSVAAHVRHRSASVSSESYEELGHNFRMSDVHAAIGRVQLARLTDMVSRRRRLAERYRRGLSGVAALTLPVEPAGARSNWQSFAVRLSPSLDQRAVMQALLDRGIATRRGIMNAHREPAYPRGTWACVDGGRESGRHESRSDDDWGDALRCSERAQDRTILLPLWGAMTDAEQDTVTDALIEIAGPSQ